MRYFVVRGYRWRRWRRRPVGLELLRVGTRRLTGHEVDHEGRLRHEGRRPRELNWRLPRHDVEFRRAARLVGRHHHEVVR